MPKRISIDESAPPANPSPQPAPASGESSSPEPISPAVPPGVAPNPPAGNASGIPTDSLGHVHNTSADIELWKRSGSSVLSAFCAYPAAMQFSGEEDQEEIVLLLRAHIVTNVPWLAVAAIAAVIPLVLAPLTVSFNFLPNLGIGLGVVLTLFWYLGVFTYSFLNFLYWFFNVYIVTDERIVDVDWYSVVNRDMKFAEISRIEDVTASQFGVLAGIFDFGNVKIETAGTEPNIEFERVPHPQLVAKKIQELMQLEEVEGERRV